MSKCIGLLLDPYLTCLPPLIYYGCKVWAMRAAELWWDLVGSAEEGQSNTVAGRTNLLCECTCVLRIHATGRRTCHGRPYRYD